ncbi:MAG TPA: NAD(P)/FAD-dependent oxidoreductase [Solirubrobacteraceae bacterium]
MSETSPRRRRVVIVGSGFGGMQAAKRLKKADVDVTVIDRHNHLLFQPLIYQMAAGALSAGEVAAPIRHMLKRQPNATTLMAEVTDVDVGRRQVVLGGEERVDYDSLIVACGCETSYFGHDEWSERTTGLKTLSDAFELRNRIFGAFEEAELAEDPDVRDEWLTFVVVGGGPTGVEISGQLAILARHTMTRDFRRIDPRAARVILLDAGERVVAAFSEPTSATAAKELGQLGVTVRERALVTDIDAHGVTVKVGDQTERIRSRTVMWAAGVRAVGLTKALAQAAGVETDRAGRVHVNPDLTLPGHPEVFAIGDMVRLHEAVLPGVAPVAMQQGRYVARVIRDRLDGKTTPPFRYRDKGNLATIGRAAAVADIKGLHLSGFAAWVTWLVVHLWYLVGFQNRVLVFIRWSVSFLTHGRGARLITNTTNS